MNTLLLIGFFLFGAIIGSFLNVVLFRFNTGRGIGGRSKCFSCKRTLRAVDLVPVFSYLAFRGRCRTCRSKISFQYPAVEILTGLLFAGTYILYAPLLLTNINVFVVQMIYACIVMALIVLITIYDIRHKIIPDAFAYTFAIVSFIALFVMIDQQGHFYLAIPQLIDLAAGLILAFPFYFLWLVSRGRWMGLGDAKLALGMGWFLGLSGGGTAVIYGFWIGAGLSVLLILLSKIFPKHGSHLSMKSEIPFAPFLITGLLIVYFFGYNMFEVLL